MAVEAGFDGCEIHGAHGYLGQQSISPWLNRRDRPVGRGPHAVPAPGHRGRPGTRSGRAGSSATARRPTTCARPRTAVSARRAWCRDRPRHAGDRRDRRPEHDRRPRRQDLRPGDPELPATARRSTCRRPRQLDDAIGHQVPMIGVGRIASVGIAEILLQSGACEMVAMTRAHIADPDIVRQVRSRRGAPHPAVRRRARLQQPQAGRVLRDQLPAQPRGDARARTARRRRRPSRSDVVVVGAGRPA